mmetsp:Transcript_1659/g.3029  ORF Transcript_1659/g.3029 Transcript_1659/m.3029 type:complete len:261 (+) Transcript_1659:180-962(+)
MSELNHTSEKLLSVIQLINSYGAETWDLRVVTATSAVFFLGMRATVGHKYNIDWDAFVHAILSGVGSAICIYLNYYAAVHMTGITEPLGSMSCNGALTSLHRIIPAITQGYAVCDIINGFRLGPAFLAHGIATFTVSAIFCELGASHILTPMLVMEISTIVLAILRAEFLSPQMQLITQATFAFLFFFCRIVLSPVVYYDIVLAMNQKFGDCFPAYLYYVTLIFGMFFHLLNGFWFYKLVLKIKRKLSGQESMDVSEKLD